MNISLEEYIRKSENASQAYYAYLGSTWLTDTVYLYVNTSTNIICLILNIICFVVCRNIDRSVRKDFSTMYGYIEIYLLIIAFTNLNRIGIFIPNTPS